MSLFPLSNIMLIQSRVRHLLGDRPGKNLSTGPYALSVVLTELLELLAAIDGDSSCAKSGASPPTSPSGRSCSLVGESVTGAVAARASDNAALEQSSILALEEEVLTRLSRCTK